MKEKGIEKTREYKERAKRENWYTVPNAISASRLAQVNFKLIRIKENSLNSHRSPRHERNCGMKLILLTFRDYMPSVKPFKSKNRDKIYLDAPNPNLKKVVIEIFERQPNL